MEKIQVSLDPELINIGSHAAQQMLQVHFFGHAVMASLAVAFMMLNVAFFKYLKNNDGHEILGFPIALGGFGFLVFLAASLSAVYIKCCPEAYLLDQLLSK